LAQSPLPSLKKVSKENKNISNFILFAYLLPPSEHVFPDDILTYNHKKYQQRQNDFSSGTGIPPPPFHMSQNFSVLLFYIILI
jgi:hypothetical protein